MGIWLGKQILGQTDQIDHHVTGGVQLIVVLPREGSLVEPEESRVLRGGTAPEPVIDAEFAALPEPEST